MALLGLIGGDNSEMEDLSDIDDPVGDVENHPSQQEKDSSECEDPFVHPTKPIRGCKRLSDKYEYIYIINLYL